ncbi:MAG: HAMP domain-containing protein, partial [Candidatus Adiutrix sp.]|nr:HAMP domain-containing protein [Candidatus Adiutrix sp.]
MLEEPDSGPSPSEERELSPDQSQRKRRLEFWAALAAAAALAGLTLLQREVINLGPGLNRSQGLVALVSINASVALMIFLLLLILRGLYKVFFEQRSYGTLQTKLVVAFIALSLLPTLLIFYYSYRQLIRGHGLWFSPRIESALRDSIDLTGAALLQDNRLLAAYGGGLLNEAPFYLASDNGAGFLERARARLDLAGAEIYDLAGRRLMAAEPAPPPLPETWFGDADGAGRAGPDEAGFRTVVTSTPAGYLTRLVWPLPAMGLSRPAAAGPAFLALGRLTPAPVHARIEDVRNALMSYQDALNIHRPFRVTQLTALTATALVAVFISIWIGAHLARTLARPVLALVRGTRRVAAGDWDFQLEPQGRSGEFAGLVNSFNQMTGDLKKMYVELDSRRRFVETVLENVSTGVVVLSPSGRVISFNLAAAGILGLEGENGPLPPPLAALADLAVREPGFQAVEQHLRLSLGDDFASLRVKLAPLAGEGGERLGLLLTFDDHTELEKAQRLAAWQEVARRIAHEVKNPLTPIQLSAGRLRRRFSQRLAGEEDAAVFEECTAVIISQVEEMKKLVDEFSRFARLPEIKPRPGDFVRMLDESLALFRQAHKKVD